MGQIHHEELRPLHSATPDDIRFSEIDLRVARRMLLLQTFEDLLCRVPLLPDLLLVLFQDLIDHSQKDIQLRPLYRLLSLIARRRGIA